MRISAFIGGVALGTLLSAPAMAGGVPAGPFTATLTGLPSSSGYGSVSTDTYYTGPYLCIAEGPRKIVEDR